MVMNTKGGASKSTFSLQVAATYFLEKNQDVELVEFDDENKDSNIFSSSKIKTSTALVGQSKDDVLVTLREQFEKTDNNIIFDIGGNKTTTMLLDALQRSRLYHLIDLFIIPMSGGSQDFINAKKTYETLEKFNKPIVFGLSRVRRIDRIRLQYQEFFTDFPNHQFLVLTDSDVIDLSRRLNKSVFELATETKAGDNIKQLDKLIAEAFMSNDIQKGTDLSHTVGILEDSIEYHENILKPCYATLERLLVQND